MRLLSSHHSDDFMFEVYHLVFCLRKGTSNAPILKRHNFIAYIYTIYSIKFSTQFCSFSPLYDRLLLMVAIYMLANLNSRANKKPTSNFSNVGAKIYNKILIKIDVVPTKNNVGGLQIFRPS